MVPGGGGWKNFGVCCMAGFLLVLAGVEFLIEDFFNGSEVRVGAALMSGSIA